jgi:predicted nucleotide-binding protein (sugar kinase/HSP70/actin superfamily)
MASRYIMVGDIFNDIFTKKVTYMKKKYVTYGDLEKVVQPILDNCFKKQQKESKKFLDKLLKKFK